MRKAWEHQPWTISYRRAVLEMNPVTAINRLQTAQVAIRTRIAELALLQGSGQDMGEVAALKNATKILQLLQKEQRPAA